MDEIESLLKNTNIHTGPTEEEKEKNYETLLNNISQTGDILDRNIVIPNEKIAMDIFTQLKYHNKIYFDYMDKIVDKINSEFGLELGNELYALKQVVTINNLDEFYSYVKASHEAYINLDEYITNMDYYEEDL